MRAGRIAACALLLMACGAASAATETVRPADKPNLRAAREAYWRCASLEVPSRLSRVGDMRKAAAEAADKCQTEQVALAGHYALQNPGAKDVERYMEQARRQLIDDLSRWMTDLESMYIQRGE